MECERGILIGDAGVRGDGMGKLKSCNPLMTQSAASSAMMTPPPPTSSIAASEAAPLGDVEDFGISFVVGGMGPLASENHQQSAASASEFSQLMGLDLAIPALAATVGSPLDGGSPVVGGSPTADGCSPMGGSSIVSGASPITQASPTSSANEGYFSKVVGRMV